MKKRRKSVILRVAVFAFILYICTTLVNLQIQINDKKSELAEINGQCKAQQAQNDQTKRLLVTNNKDQFIGNVARDKLDYAKPGEQIFINASGN